MSKQVCVNYIQCAYCENWTNCKDYDPCCSPECYGDWNVARRLDVGDIDDEDGFPIWFDGRWVNSKEIE